MMAAFRAFAKSPWAAVLMGVLILSFGVWGVRDVFHNRISDAVVTAGSRQVSSPEFKQIFDGRLRDLQQQNGGEAISAQEAVDHGFHKQLLDRLADQESVMEEIRRVGVQPADTLIIARLRKIPAFFNKVTGTFDHDAYVRALGEQNLTVTQFESDLKDDIAQQQFSIGLVAGLAAPRTYSALTALLAQQSREADYFLLDPKSAPKPAAPTEAELVKFMKDNADRLRRPELRAISLVRISAQALQQTLPVSPADVQKQFDFEKDRLSVPEKRTFVEVPAKDAGQAAAIVARLRKGEDATSVARAYAAKPINYVDASRATVADPGVAAAVFALQAGQVSGPIQGAFGFAVVKLVTVSPGKPATLQDVRARIEDEVKKNLALEKADELAHNYDDAHADGAALPDAAKKAGVQVYQIGPITQDGRAFPSGQQWPGLNARMLADAFSLSQGAETDINGLGKGEYYALRVDKVAPSAVPTLAELRPQLVPFVMQQAVVKALQAKAEALAARLRKGESVAAVAASAGASVKHVTGVTQINATQQQQALGQEFLGRMFQAKAGEVFVAGAPGGIAVGRLAAVRPGALMEVARTTEAARQQLTANILQNDFGEMVSQAARAKVKPRVDEQLAVKAVGATEAQTPASGAKPSSKAP